MRSSAPSSRMVASAPALASASIFSRRSAPAIWAARPDTKVWREAEDFPASSVRSVSETTMSILSMGRPSASAMIWSMIVDEP